jgi:hypothetical protein
VINENEFSFRIEKLETENRRIKLILCFCVVVLGVFTAFVLRERVRAKDTLEAKEFLLKDQSGQTLARLSSGSVGTCFEILGKTNQASAMLCAGDESGSDLLLTTEHGTSRAFLSAGGRMYESVGESILPSLMIAQDGKGLVRATVGTNQNLGLHADQNAAVTSISKTQPTINLLDNNGKILWTAP